MNSYRRHCRRGYQINDIGQMHRRLVMHMNGIVCEHFTNKDERTVEGGKERKELLSLNLIIKLESFWIPYNLYVVLHQCELKFDQIFIQALKLDEMNIWLKIKEKHKGFIMLLDFTKNTRQHWGIRESRPSDKRLTRAVGLAGWNI